MPTLQCYRLALSSPCLADATEWRLRLVGRSNVDHSDAVSYTHGRVHDVRDERPLAMALYQSAVVLDPSFVAASRNIVRLHKLYSEYSAL